MSFIILSNRYNDTMINQFKMEKKCSDISVFLCIGQIYSTMYGRDQIGVASRQHQCKVQCSGKANICKLILHST